MANKIIEAIKMAVCENTYPYFDKNGKPVNVWKAKEGYDALDALMVEVQSDVVKVVRCKDCAVPHNEWTGCPNLNGLIPPPDFYCARGERKIRKEEVCETNTE